VLFLIEYWRGKTCLRPSLKRRGTGFFWRPQLVFFVSVLVSSTDTHPPHPRSACASPLTPKHVCLCVCACICAYVIGIVCVSMCEHVCMCVCVCLCSFEFASVCVYMHVYWYRVCVCVTWWCVRQCPGALVFPRFTAGTTTSRPSYSAASKSPACSPRRVATSPSGTTSYTACRDPVNHSPATTNGCCVASIIYKKDL